MSYHRRNSTSNSDPTSSNLNECETRFVSGMERDRSDWSRSIRQQEIFESQPGNFGWMDRAHNKCKLFCVYSRGILVYLKSSSYFTPTYYFANLCCQGFAKLPSDFVCLVFQSETRQNSPTHQALPGQKVSTNRTESRGFSMHRGRREQQIHHHR